jgi:hypothetical protein
MTCATASLADLACADLKLVQDQVGHASTVFTPGTYTAVLAAAMHKGSRSDRPAHPDDGQSGALRDRLGGLSAGKH